MLQFTSDPMPIPRSESHCPRSVDVPMLPVPVPRRTERTRRGSRCTGISSPRRSCAGMRRQSVTSLPAERGHLRGAARYFVGGARGSDCKSEIRDSGRHDFNSVSRTSDRSTHSHTARASSPSAPARHSETVTRRPHAYFTRRCYKLNPPQPVEVFKAQPASDSFRIVRDDAVRGIGVAAS